MSKINVILTLERNKVLFYTTSKSKKVMSSLAESVPKLHKKLGLIFVCHHPSSPTFFPLNHWLQPHVSTLQTFPPSLVSVPASVVVAILSLTIILSEFGVHLKDL